MAQQTNKPDIYQELTDRMIAALERGTAPWHQGWSVELAPRNLTSGKRYRGINTFLLSIVQADNDYSSPYWLTFKQCKERGGHVKAGEKGTPVIFWKRLPITTTDEETGEEGLALIPFAKKYTVFNACQCEGIEVPVTERSVHLENEQIAAAEKIAAEMPNRPHIEHNNGSSSFYRPSTDTVTLPYLKYFDSAPDYYSTLFHELGHSTGHKNRLNRQINNKFGSEKYSREELVAELTSVFLCSECGLTDINFDNSAAYINSWLKELKNDKKLVVIAAAQAQKAADYILNRKFAD